jgi:hypothetical protein
MSLGVQQRSVCSLARSKPLDVVRDHAVKELGMVPALHGELAAKGEIREAGGLTHRLVLRHRVGETHRNKGAMILAQRGAL